MADFDREAMLEMFSFEMSQLVEQLEQTIIQAESGYSMDQINEVFRIMHTIKGSAAMMLFDNISASAHAIEDLFFYLREENPQGIDYSRLTDYVLSSMDFIKAELEKVEQGIKPDGDGSATSNAIKQYLQEIKGEKPSPSAPVAAPVPAASVPAALSAPSASSNGKYHYKALIRFSEGCEMENIRAFSLVHNLGDFVADITHVPQNIIDEAAMEEIRKNGFQLSFVSDITYDEIYNIIMQTAYLESVTLEEVKQEALVITEAPAVTGPFSSFKALIYFEEGAEMENVRAYTLVHNIQNKAKNIHHSPSDLISEEAIGEIKSNGFTLYFDAPMTHAEAHAMLSATVYLKSLALEIVSDDKSQGAAATNADTAPAAAMPSTPAAAGATPAKKPAGQSIITVNVSKLDQLLNLMGELVIAEAMVTQNPELEALELESFHKEALQLRKIITDVQDTVMSMRMVPLSTTFFKMHRIVRDMCKQLSKDVTLEIAGETTEVDKNIIEHIADPLMHIIRNSIDHGIETPQERARVGKPERGVVNLEAKNSGGDVLIIIKDDGAGLKRDKILAKAKANGLLRKPENEYTDKEIYQFIFLPGFSTNEQVTNYSGRGVGMDVVSTNLEVVGGSALVDSVPGEGSVFTLKIPLTLAIIAGMTIRMGGAKYTIPIISIKQSFKAQKDSIFVDPSGNEMITVRGEVYNLVRLYEFFGVDSEIQNPEDGIVMMLENGDQTVCVMADELVGEQQVVVKTMPKYIGKPQGISGCTLLGNGDISLIIDVVAFFDK